MAGLKAAASTVTPADHAVQATLHLLDEIFAEDKRGESRQHPFVTAPGERKFRIISGGERLHLRHAPREEFRCIAKIMTHTIRAHEDVLELPTTQEG